MRHIIRKFANFLLKKDNKGTVVVEFALVITPFLMLILFTMELSRVIYAYAAIDLSLSTASQQAANAGSIENNSTDYQVLFSAAFRDQIDKTPLLFKNDQIDITVSYCNSIDQVVTNSCSSDSSNSLAVYSVVYHYKPIFFIFPGDLMTPSLARNIVHVQEFSRAAL